MGFDSVYGCLQEVFPKIDHRILKAVAIENSKDVDAAVADVLSEVLPHLMKSAVPEEGDVRSYSELKSNENIHNTGGSNGSSHDYPIKTNVPVINDDNNQSLEISTSGELFLFGKTRVSDAFAQHQNTHVTQVHGDTDGHEEVGASAETEVLVSCEEDANRRMPQENPVDLTSSLINEQGGSAGTLNGQCHDQGDFDAAANSHDIVNPVEDTEGDSHLYDSLSDFESFACQPFPSFTEEQIGDAIGCHHTSYENFSLCKLGKCIDESIMNSTGTLNTECSVDHLFLPVSTVDVPKCDLQSEFCSAPPSNQDHSVNETFSQVCRIEPIEEVIEEIIDNAKNSKKTLFSAMESVMNMMRDVELQEKSAELAKEEAIKGGLDILDKVQELKQILAHAKEANDMVVQCLMVDHAGEVYGEKAILTAEARELQSRLFSLLEERDKSLAMLDEMLQTLEARLAATEEERKAAEQEKLEKEETAREALAQQEAIMDEVVKESKKLQKEAEENSKLREFLMDRGQIVDVLQGEISVICQDIVLLKEKFDECVPLSQSISSSQTSCILASSGSFLKSAASALVLEQQEDSLKNLKMDSSVTYVDCEPPQVLAEEEIVEQGELPKNLENASPDAPLDGQLEKVITEEDRLLEDGWDILDKEEELVS